MIEGTCLCGGVRYRIDGELGAASHCHCSMCRKVHGAPFGTYATVRRQDFRFDAGSEMVKTYRSSKGVERTFCGNCGSTLQVLFENEPKVLYLAMGSIDGDPGRRPSYHIFVGSKAPWHQITDDLPQYETWSDRG